MIVPFWVAQNPSLWKSLFPGFFFAFSFLGNFPTSVGDHDMGVVTHCVLPFYTITVGQGGGHSWICGVSWASVSAICICNT